MDPRLALLVGASLFLLFVFEAVNGGTIFTIPALGVAQHQRPRSGLVEA